MNPFAFSRAHLRECAVRGPSEEEEPGATKGKTPPEAGESGQIDENGVLGPSPGAKAPHRSEKPGQRTLPPLLQVKRYGIFLHPPLSCLAMFAGGLGILVPRTAALTMLSRVLSPLEPLEVT